MMISPWRFCLCLATLGVCTAPASAVVLFSDGFNTTGSSSAWTINSAPTANAANQSATFAFDYSAFGIPAAPGSADTLGLRLRANIPGTPEAPRTDRPAGAVSGLSLSPAGMNFGTNYQMTFYAWSNHFGAANASGLADVTNSEGGTNNVIAVVGTSGTVPIVVGNTLLATNASMDGVGFATTGDGGITNDYRAYPASGTFTPGATAGVYAAGANANTNAFYTALFPAVAAPEVQKALSTAEYDDGNDAGSGDTLNTQNGLTQPGSFGFAWQKVVVTKNNGIATWHINDVLIATVNASALTLGGANVAIGVSDATSSTARHPSLVFTVFDNLVVTDLPPAGLAGDFNNDSKVDGGDFLVWQRGGSPSPTSAADLATWKTNYGQGITPVSAVPEPGTLGLALLGLVALGVVRRRS